MNLTLSVTDTQEAEFYIHSVKLILTLHLEEQGLADAAQPSVLATGLRQGLEEEVPAKQFVIGLASEIVTKIKI